MGLALALLELWAPENSERILARPDPVLFFLSERQAVRLAAFLLLATGVLAVSPTKESLRLACVLLVGTAFAAYQLSRWLFPTPSGCACLHNAASLLGLDAQWVTILKHLVILFLTVPSAVLLSWRNRRKT
ncbi:MAG: hypothetical protein D6766_13930 [Verrucomicrobia bacterium]|nr:MAG: hypothetical protein D6766_13930 [Verrucomicrobiota bacterium]